MDEHHDYFLDEYDDSGKESRVDPRTIVFDNSTFDSAPPRRTEKPRRLRNILTLSLIVLLAAVLLFYFRYLNPYVSEARISGFVTSVEKRGTIFKTFEGDMISVTALTDTVRHFTGDFVFSIPDEDLARKIMSLEGTGKKVTIVYKKYHGSLPWRGATPNIAVALQP